MSWLPLGAAGSPWRVESGTWEVTADGGQLIASDGGTPRTGSGGSGGDFACISVETGQQDADITVTNDRANYDGFGSIEFAMQPDPTTGVRLSIGMDGSHALNLEYFDGVTQFFVDDWVCTEWEATSSGTGTTTLHVTFDAATAVVTVEQDGTPLGSIDVAAWAVAFGHPLPSSWGTLVGLGGNSDAVTAGEVWSAFTAAGMSTTGPWLPVGAKPPEALTFVTWQTLSTIATIGEFHQYGLLAAHGGKLYYSHDYGPFGGVYDPSSDTWANWSAACYNYPTVYAQSIAGCADPSGDSIWICGNWGGTDVDPIDPLTERPGLVRYFPATDTYDGPWINDLAHIYYAPWSSYVWLDIDSARQLYGCVATETHVYYLWANADSAAYRPTSTFLAIFNRATETWAQSSDAPLTFEMGSMTLGSDGRLYIAGAGVDDDVPSIRTLVIYDPSTDAWSLSSPGDGNHHFAQIVSDGLGHLYVLGGRLDGDDADVFEAVYTIATDTWQPFVPVPFVGLGIEHRATMLDQHVYVASYSTTFQRTALAGSEEVPIGLSSWVPLRG